MTNELNQESGNMTKAESTVAGYSGTPLAKKLGIKPGHRLAILGVAVGWAIPDLPEAVVFVMDDSSRVDVVLAFFCEAAELISDIAGLSERIFPVGSLWIAWPRKAAGHASDISENLLRNFALPLGIVDVKVAAIDNDWSGLKFVWRVEHRKLLSPPLPGNVFDD